MNNSNKNLFEPQTDTPGKKSITVNYTEENIRHLSDMEHIRTRPGMYIGRLGDGSLPEDGIYVLLKEVIDNSIDEFKMNAGKLIEIDIEENRSFLKGQGKDVDVMNEYEIKTANTGSNVFLTAKISIVDAIEDVVLPIAI